MKMGKRVNKPKIVGLKHKSVALMSHDSIWSDIFEKERKILEKILDDASIHIEHIGSTSIRGLTAKPVIDILVGVPEISEGRRYVKLLESRGYVYRDFFRADRHLLFSKRFKDATTCDSRDEEALG